jgi:catechol 2,3-dioxygenase-like lactoylglutathione lyase family enzyme
MESVCGVNHVQVNVPPDGLDAARAFYVGFLGCREIPRPTTFSSAGIWLSAGGFELHLGVEDNVNRSATRAHVAYEVRDLAAWRDRVSERGWPMRDQPLIPGYDRFQFRDPFGNNIELIQKL